MSNITDEQRERREVLRNDQLLRKQAAEDRASTYFAQAQAEIGAELGGRFKHLSQTVVTGVPQAPMQPQGSPWRCDPVGPEPPLGYDINALVPTGEPHEVQASIEHTASASVVCEHADGPSTSACGGSAVAPVPLPTVETAEPPPSSLLRAGSDCDDQRDELTEGLKRLSKKTGWSLTELVYMARIIGQADIDPLPCGLGRAFDFPRTRSASLGTMWTSIQSTLKSRRPMHKSF